MMIKDERERNIHSGFFGTCCFGLRVCEGEKNSGRCSCDTNEGLCLWWQTREFPRLMKLRTRVALAAVTLQDRSSEELYCSLEWKKETQGNSRLFSSQGKEGISIHQDKCTGFPHYSSLVFFLSVSDGAPHSADGHRIKRLFQPPERASMTSPCKRPPDKLGHKEAQDGLGVIDLFIWVRLKNKVKQNAAIKRWVIRMKLDWNAWERCQTNSKT